MSLSRREAREMAFQFLFGHLPEGVASQLPSPVRDKAIEFKHTEYELFWRNFSSHQQSEPDEFAWELAEGTGKKLPELDATIGKLSTNWRIERMPRVDLIIIRLAAFEILHRSDIPKTVSINEAVELAKKFGSEDSAAFVNGLLDKLVKPS